VVALPTVRYAFGFVPALALVNSVAWKVRSESHLPSNDRSLAVLSPESRSADSPQPQFADGKIKATVARVLRSSRAYFTTTVPVIFG
jgi:hypothetical protein